MSDNLDNKQLNTPPKVCKHKPGEPWAEGCCTQSLLANQKVKESDNSAIKVTAELSSLAEVTS